MNASRGRLSEHGCTPTHVAARLGLRCSQLMTWDRLLDLAVLAYWQNRPRQSPQALTEYRRRQTRRRTSPEVWLRRGAA